MKTKVIICLALLFALITTIATASYGFSLVLLIALFLVVFPIPKNGENKVDLDTERLNSEIYTQTGG